MFLVVRGCSFLRVIIFKAPSLIHFMMFTNVLTKELAYILIHVRKIFNCWVFFIMLLLMDLLIVGKKF